VIEIIDKDYHHYPVFNKILSTCCQGYSHDEYNTVVYFFEQFLKLMDNDGHIPKGHFDICGVQMDKDINGK
jgi:hypothetical protein